jgi:colanic acid/amylovoran biosynthesis protein
MNILIIGQCTLHWGRMEFGNIGNYYIIEPFMRELYKVFPDASIKTTMQISERFCEDEKIEVLPMELYYGWNRNDLDIALSELASAELYAKIGVLPKETSYIKEVLKSDLVIDFSGDIWGDNADFLGEDRFLIGLIKDRVSQLLGKKTVMLAGSPGPFKNQTIKNFAKEVYENFDLITNREPLSVGLMETEGFDISKTRSLACPAFLFEPETGVEVKSLLEKEGLNSNKKKVGFILCGWNFTEGPFDKENRGDNEFIQFAEAVEFMSEKLGVDVYLMSHSNGFPIPPKEFGLIHGRDYLVVKQLQKVLKDRGIARNIHSLDEVYDAWKTKAILGNFDMLVSGRVHGAVGGLSQNVPTVIIDYGHEPKAHKIEGFATVVGVERYLADPAEKEDLVFKITECWNNRVEYRKFLEKKIPEVKKEAITNFRLLKKYLK